MGATLEVNMNNLPTYKKRRKADIIGFSHAFKEGVKKIRSELGIPLNGFPIEKTIDPEEVQGFYPKEAINWYKDHVL